MKKYKILLLLLSVMLIHRNVKAEEIKPVDVCVYGGTSAGIIAAYTAKKMGKTVIVIEPGNYVGGLTTGGLGATDIGNKFAITGLAREFYRKLGNHYGKLEQWAFEPHVADQVYADMIKEGKLNVVRNLRLTGVKKQDGYITEISLEVSDHPSRNTNKTIKAKMFIDCTYEGDLMAKAGVSYTIGREANSLYGESYNGVQLSDFHQFPDGIDPYKIPGKPESGLLYGISDASLQPIGSGDKLIQAYNFRLCLTQNKDNKLDFTRPDHYNPADYALLARVIEKEKWEGIDGKFTIKKVNGKNEIENKGNFLIKNMPNGKTDFNNFGGFSTDMIGMNYLYPEGDYDTRKKIWKAHEDYTKGMLYFLANDKSVPESVRKDMSTWGYAKDEFKDQNGFSNQLYVREARRMVGELVMTQKHCEGVEVVDDAVGMAAYSMDSHNCQRIVINGMVKNEGDVQKSVRNPFPISYRAIVPKQAECKNLLVPVCLSASHIAFGSIRMEPVFMVMGQSAATAAVMAIDSGLPVQQVNVKEIQKRLTENPLLNNKPLEVLIDNDDKLNMEIAGDWKHVRGGYSSGLLLFDAKSKKISTAKFVPEIKNNGKHAVYVYIPKLEGRTSQTKYKVFDGKSNHTTLLKAADIKEFGLSSGEWVGLGTYKLAKGKNAFVEVSTEGADGLVTADAVIFKPL
jgi:hypothetical protein